MNKVDKNRPVSSIKHEDKREPLGTGTCFTLHNLGRSDYGIRCMNSDNIRA